MPSSSSTHKPGLRPALRLGPPTLTTPVERLRGVGPRVQEKLAKLGITRLGDVLFHLPFRYSDRTRIVPIGSLLPGQELQVEGTIELTQVKMGRRRSLLCRISDGSGALTLRMFHFSRQQQAQLERGHRVRCYGTVRSGPQTLEMVHPEYQVLNTDEPAPLAETLTPVYPASEGVTQPTLRRLASTALDCLQRDANVLPDHLPPELLPETNFPGLGDALHYVHQPPTDADISALTAGTHPAQQRLAFEELLAFHLSQRQRRREFTSKPAPLLNAQSDLCTRFLQQLAFAPTAAQTRVNAEIATDMQTGQPMLRLLQGDVGAGKTLVATLAALLAIDNDWQVALMAPTELLAEQHQQNLQQWLTPLGIEPLLLTGRQKKSERTANRDAIVSGQAKMVIGTHALFQSDVAFARLGLVIIDEQHRFGVHQRLALLEKGRSDDLSPHQLIMTATPIPRTLAMALHADLDVSVLDELPPGRQPVKTVVLADSRREELVERIAAACAEQRQVYWVCPLIEESDVLDYQAAEVTHLNLTEQLAPLKIGLIHGRLPAKEKAAVMQSFKAGEIDVLVATTVIEVGVDVPNASLMVIENAERLGLAQLHQLRGRVGRGQQHSDCVLLYKAPLGELARARLDVMRQSNDGFLIAQRDLELRGPGELLGTRQTGLPGLRIADFNRDQGLIPLLQGCADRLYAERPEAVDPLIDRWQGVAADYGQV